MSKRRGSVYTLAILIAVVHLFPIDSASLSFLSQVFQLVVGG